MDASVLEERFTNGRFAEDSRKELSDLGIWTSILGHIGDGNFHASILYNKKDREQVRMVERVVYRMVDRALEMEGTCTGEVSNEKMLNEQKRALMVCSTR